ncbi:hypothetical protein [Aneurinibacillus aneurinilyticus]|uniref:Uncharacterized protein n=1 Tax=Aneurinibacillus aneurinilyticus TaxID=1391 RepID=A0A848D0V5_ANEAE|nr:hypothetical protein [Aneurinibacillus aneurinilyticus]NMF01049.1 hypothetical protein [Aneurinibacillus aneurinilyticus]
MKKSKNLLYLFAATALITPAISPIVTHNVEAATVQKQAPYISKDLLDLAKKGYLKGASTVYKIGTQYKTVKKYLTGKKIHGSEHTNSFVIGKTMIGFASRQFEKVYSTDKIITLSVEKPYVSADTVKKALGKPYKEDIYANGKAYRLIYLTGNQYVFIDGNFEYKTVNISVIDKKSWDMIP